MSVISESIRTLTGFDPFPWQRRLCDAMLSGNVPTALDIPTGLGKTSVMAIWLAAHLLGANLPRRLVYIVDRRVVVDQATHAAEELREKHPTLKLSTLRGQFADNGDWLSDPTGLAIVVGTVDMIGSRLLFSGYGVGRGMRPVHAGMLGQDTLFVLDEAHLVPPFEALLRAVTARTTRLREAHDALPPVHLLSLSATQRSSEQGTFTLDQEDMAHCVVKQRIKAPKRLMRVKIDENVLATEMAERVAGLLDAYPSARVVLFCDTRKDALAVEAALLKNRIWANRMALLTGARRVHERANAAKQIERLGFTGSRDQRDNEPAILIATSAGEVGVDFDADHAVMDLVPWERMVQRLGRVNRRGEHRSSKVIVLDKGASTQDWVRHGADPEAVRTLLGYLTIEDGTAPCGPLALRCVAEEHLHQIVAASTTAPLHPALERATLDAWSVTGLSEHTGRPEISPWLRGWVDEDRPQCAVIWRKYLPPEGTPKPEIEQFFRAASPHLFEKLEAEAWQVADWLAERSKEIGMADARARKSGEDPLLPKDGHAAIVLAPDGAVREVTTFEVFRELGAMKAKDAKAKIPDLANATLVVSTLIGGLSEQGMLHVDSDGPGESTADGETWGEDLPWRCIVQKPSREDMGTVADDAVLSDGAVETFRLPIKKSWETVTEWLVIGRIRPGADELTGSARGNAYLALDCHNTDVEARVAASCEVLGLSSELTEVFRTAARLHDVGKAAEIWQRFARAPVDRGAVAKSPRFGDPRILNGYRHEFGSLLEAEDHADIAALPESDRDLALHLIASHHGHARPFIRPDGGPRPAESVEGAALDVALRFARLQEEWGPWGLAWLESILRAADRAASEHPMEGIADG